MAGALIVTAEIAPPDLSWLDRLRRLHYPPERNQLPAHAARHHRSGLASLSRRPVGASRAILVSWPLGDVADAVAAEIECSQTGIEHGSEHRLLHQFLDRFLGARVDEVLGFLHRLIP